MARSRGSSGLGFGEAGLLLMHVGIKEDFPDASFSYRRQIDLSQDHESSDIVDTQHFQKR